MLLLLLSCAPELVVVSPPQGSIITAPWVPLFVDIGENRVGEQPRVSLDGDPLAQPFGASHVRYERLGEGSEWIGTLDLSTLAPGDHRVRLTFDRGVAESVFTFEPPEHRVQVSVARPDGTPIWAKVLVFDADGEPVLLTGPNVEETDPRVRDHSLHTVLVRDGTGVFWLDEGSYTLIVSRGIRDGVERFDLRVDEDTVIESTLALEVPTPGWSTSELHLHTAWSPDSFAPGEPRFDSLLCSDVQAAAITDHDLVAPVPLEAIAERYGTQLTVIAGMESSHSLYDDVEDDWDTIGHFNLIPWEDQGLTKHLDSADQLVALHAPARIQQINHPRGIEFNVEEGPQFGIHAFLSAMGTPIGSPLAETERSAPLLASTFWPDLDAMEVLNRFSWDLYRAVRTDWFALWAQGYAITGTGNADTHALEQELIGFPVNLTPCPPEDGVDADCLQDAVARGALRVSTGPIVSLSLQQGAGPVGEGELMRVRSGRPLVANLQVQAASWVPVDEVRLVVDGVVQERWSLEARDGVLDWRETVELDLAEGDHFVLLEAGHPIFEDAPTDDRDRLGLYGWVAPSYVPVGWSNPVRVDGDGDGEWTPQR